MSITTRTAIPRPRLHRQVTGPTPTPPVPQHRPGRRNRAQNAVAAAAVVAALSATTGLFLALSNGNDTAPPSAPVDVPFQSTLPQGIDGSDVHLYNRAAEHRALRESAEGSDRRLYNKPGASTTP